LADVKGDLDVLRAVDDRVVEAIEGAESADVLEYLIYEQKLDLHHEGDQGVGRIRRAVLESSKASQDLKRTVITRGDDTPETVLVPDNVERNARTVLRTGKPVVLYGPTGTGKTTFAKQLALRHCVGYSLHTATPSWTAKDIIGGIGPNLTGSSGYRSLNYETELGAVSDGVKRARDFDIPYALILDEITRADISQIFGPLYTAIENRNQTLIETDDGETIELDEDVSIICTMNMSDRTVNELDNAITRRFAMVELLLPQHLVFVHVFRAGDVQVLSNELVQLFGQFGLLVEAIEALEGLDVVALGLRGLPATLATHFAKSSRDGRLGFDLGERSLRLLGNPSQSADTSA
jgi:5-methylcytosine-specific restriction protein B